MNIYANRRKDGTRFYLGKQDFGFMFGDEDSKTFFFANSRKDYEKKNPDGKPTHSLIVEKVKAPKILAAMPFLLTKRPMNECFEIAEEM